MSPALPLLSRAVSCGRELACMSGLICVSPLPGQPAPRQLLSPSLVVLAADAPLAHSVPEVEAAL